MADLHALDLTRMDDRALATWAARGERLAVELITARNNQRLYRVAWGILRNRAEAEDVVQDTYLRAFRSLSAFRGGASLSTWLTRIAINEALARKRADNRRFSQLREQGVLFLERYREMFMRGSSAVRDAEDTLVRGEVAALLEKAIGELPDPLRLIFILRDVEGLSVEDAADASGINPQTVRTRLFRARRKLRSKLEPALGGALKETLQFAGAQCRALTSRVLVALEGNISTAPASN